MSKMNREIGHLFPIKGLLVAPLPADRQVIKLISQDCLPLIIH